MSEIVKIEINDWSESSVSDSEELVFGKTSVRSIKGVAINFLSIWNSLPNIGDV